MMKLPKLILVFMILFSVAMLGCDSGNSTPWQPADPPVVDVPDPADETPDLVIDPPVDVFLFESDEDEDTDDETADAYLTEV